MLTSLDFLLALGDSSGRDMRSRRKVKAGDAISVYWRADQWWYDGEVKWIDEATNVCEVLYEDGEREELNLTRERYKIKDGKGEELIDRVLASEGDVSKQLKHIADVIRDIADRLPAVGCCSSREGWWSDWYSAIDSAVEAGHVIKLVKVTYDLGCQLRPCVTTSWWEAESENWRERLRSVMTCEGLVNSVEELRIKGVEWRNARQLFTSSSS